MDFKVVFQDFMADNDIKTERKQGSNVLVIFLHGKDKRIHILKAGSVLTSIRQTIGIKCPMSGKTND